MDLPHLLDVADRLAQQAAEVILRIRARGFATEHKADASPVTEADHAAEALILAGLRQACPELPVIAEEQVAAGIQAAHAGTYWLVDPLDGTREFAAGRDDFAVNIGLVRDGRPLLGVVGLPAYAETFAGIVGGTAWKRDAAGQRPIRARAPAADGLSVLVSRSHRHDARVGRYLARYRIAEQRDAGSAVKFCRLAEGLADLYPRFGPTMEWDTAAPQAVLEAAGGCVLVAPGDPGDGPDGPVLRYGKPGWLNPSFVCHGAR
jgi:3'(2'), 5'-bisphosphate nucleotidase